MSDFIPKCSVREGRFVDPCSHLSAVAQYEGGRARGIYCGERINIKTNAHARTFYAVRSGKHTKNGVLLNFCPFCGEKIIALAGLVDESADEATDDQAVA